MTDRPLLHALADRCGVARSYAAYDGSEARAQDPTLEALLVAMGFDGSSEERAEEGLRSLEVASTQPGLEPVRVVRAGSVELSAVELRVPPGTRGRLRWRLEVQLETGELHLAEGESEAVGEVLAVPVPAVSELGLGYHALRCQLDFGSGESASTQDLIVVPAACLRTSDLIGERRGLGVWGHLYALFSRSSWGIGDLGDLRALVEWATGLGLEFVGINPLHATDNTAREVSPYHPLSRLYRNPIYLELPAMVERLGSDEARAPLEDAALQELRSELLASRRVDYPRTFALKQRIFGIAHGAFATGHRGRRSELGRAYADYRAREARALDDWATFCALREQLSAEDARNLDWRCWPEPYRDARGTAVAAFGTAHAEAVDLHAYLQFELEEQLAGCQRAARGLGMPIGLYGDLALGDAPASGDVWAQPELYARTVSIGAPPDAYSDAGQDWGLTPFDPLKLRADRYRTWTRVLRQAFRHMGLLRLDHVMGLGRQFWVPAGARAGDGAYVGYPLADLLGILALESRRAGCLVVGEDLGVVPEGFRELMAERGILRSHVLYFERDAGGGFTTPRAYARASLATVGTHDLPPLAGFWAGADLRARREAGNLASDQDLARVSAERELAKSRLLALLRSEGLLPAEPEEPPLDALVEAVQLLLAGAASRLVGLALDDLTLEAQSLNTPATSGSEPPNWSRRSSLCLEDLAASEPIRALVRRMEERIRGH